MAKHILRGWVVAAVLTVVAVPIAHSLPPPCLFSPDAGAQGEKVAVDIFLFCGLAPADPEALPRIFFDDRRIKVKVTGGAERLSGQSPRARISARCVTRVYQAGARLELFYNSREGGRRPCYG